MYTPASLKNVRAPTSVILALTEALNFSLAANTWRSYRTAENHLARIRKELGVNIKFPFDLEATLTFTGYLLTRGLAANTVQKYLTAIRTVHLSRGEFAPWLLPEVVKSVITGAANRDQLRKRMEGKKGRLAVTPREMHILLDALKACKLPRHVKRLIWVSATWCFSGAFRVHEILSRSPRTFDPTVTLLGKDVNMSNVTVNGDTFRVVKVFLKHPKEMRLSAGVTIDLFEVRGEAAWLCPVSAFVQWKADKPLKPSPTLPLFRLKTGEGFTGRLLNSHLAVLLKKEAMKQGGSFSSHSFRAGLATASCLFQTCRRKNTIIGNFGIHLVLSCYLFLLKTFYFIMHYFCDQT